MPAPKGNQYAVGNNGGRPTLYKEEYCDLAYKFCLLGATNEELAKNFDVAESTLNEWIANKEEFSDAVRRGKEIADAEVANSFYNRAKGYDLPSEKVFQYEGDIIRAKTITHYPSDPGAALNWLKNRQPKKWRDKTEVDVNAKISEIDYSKLSDATLQEIASAGTDKS